MEQEQEIYQRAVLVKTIEIQMKDLTENYQRFILNILQQRYEGKCIEEGFVKPKSIRADFVLSAGALRASIVVFHVQFECQICVLAEKMQLRCRVIDTISAGIQAVSTFFPSPFRVMIYNEEFSQSWAGSKYKIDDIIDVTVLDVSSEINNTEIQVIAKINEPEKRKRNMIEL